MRALVESIVIAQFKAGLDEVSVGGYGAPGPWENPDGTPGRGRYTYMLLHCLYQSLQEKRITIEHYVSMLSDEQLLEALDGQACLRYR